MYFNHDTVYQLEQHSSSKKSTYAYYFTENYKSDSPKLVWSLPDWLKTGADHGDEVPFVFGTTYFKSGKVRKDELWESKFNQLPSYQIYINFH